MIPIKTSSEQEIMRQGGQILAEIIDTLMTSVEPNIKKRDINKLALKLCRENKVKPSFLGYRGFPFAICISLNNEVVHGMADDRVINKGDLVSLDLGILHNGFHVDKAVTFVCGGGGSSIQKKLVSICEKSLNLACEIIKNGVQLGDISEHIQKTIESEGFGVVRMLVGHGIGRDIHEEPAVPNYGKKETGPILKTGMAIALEPMITEGSYDVVLSDDGHTYKTEDGKLSAHFEHTILVTDEGCEVLTKKKSE